MIGIVIAAACVVAAGGVGIARLFAGRTEERSVEGYERALDTLGGVARRSEAKAPVHAPSPPELAQPHVHPPELRPEYPPGQEPIPAAIHLRPPSLAKDGPIVFVDDGMVGEASETAHSETRPRRRRPAPPPPMPATAREPEPTEHMVFTARIDDFAPTDEVAPLDGQALRRSPRSARPPSKPTRQGRPLVRIGVVVVVLAGIGVGAWQLSSSRSNGSNSASSNPPVPSAPSHGAHGKPTPTPTTLPTKFEPRSTSSSLVVYDVPPGPLHVTFTVTGTSWFGAFTGSVSSPHYTWMQTLGDGEAASYDSSGSISIRLGNPGATSMEVNGTPVDLPSGNVQPYDVTLDVGAGST
jgi:hypothetical protein